MCFCKLSQTLGLKEEHWKILSLRPIKYFMEKMFYGKKRKGFFISFTNKMTKTLDDLEV